MRIGIDLGGTKIAAMVLDDEGRARAERRVPTPHGDYAGTLRAIGTLVLELEHAAGAPCRVGIGMPGTLSPATGLVKNANSTCLNGQPLDVDLTRLLDRPLRFANDANCLALSEAADGAARGAGVVFGVILGTGTGGGIVVDGHLVTGANAIGGEWGHNPLPWPRLDEWPGPPCYCGRTGCAETFLSGPGMARDHGAVDGALLDAAAIDARATAGDPRAIACLDRYVERLARGLAGVINLLDPDVIVLGGGLSAITRLYRDVPAAWPRYVFSDRIVTRLRPALHGPASGVRGAARLWPVPGADGE